MATVTRGTTYGSTETITNAKLHILVDDATVTGIVNADVSAGAAIASSKIDLTSAGYVTTGANNAFTGNNSFAGTHGVSGAATFTSTVNLTGATVTGVNEVPTGVILLWSGAISAIPTGYVICDGTNSTPDLTDRFVIHADNDSGGTNDVGDSGGAKTISLANLPAHTHGSTGAHTHIVNTYSQGAEGTSASFLHENITPVAIGITSSAGAHTHTSVGSGTAYMPKFYALAYIMKT